MSSVIVATFSREKKKPFERAQGFAQHIFNRTPN